ALEDFHSAAKLGSNWARCEEAWLLGRRGDREGALRIVKEMQAVPNWNALPFYLAIVYAGIGDRDEAFRLLDVAESERVPFLFRIRTMAEFDPIRADPRFAALEQRLD